MKKKGLFFIFLILIINLSYIDSARCFWSNCLNCGNDYLGDCKICADGYYINSVGACFKCWSNCLDCGNDRTGRCKICEDGYYINSVGGCFKNYKNDKNDENDENDNGFPTFAIVLIVVISAISILGIFLCCCCCKRKNQNNNIGNNYNNQNNKNIRITHTANIRQESPKIYFDNNTNNNINNQNNAINLNINVKLGDNNNHIFNNNINDNIDKKSEGNDLPPAAIVMDNGTNLPKIDKPFTNEDSDRQYFNDIILEKEFEFYIIHDISFNKKENSECNLCSRANCNLAHFKCECSLRICKECFIKYKKNFKVCPKCKKDI